MGTKAMKLNESELSFEKCWDYNKCADAVESFVAECHEKDAHMRVRKYPVVSAWVTTPAKYLKDDERGIQIAFDDFEDFEEFERFFKAFHSDEKGLDYMDMRLTNWHNIHSDLQYTRLTEWTFNRLCDYQGLVRDYSKIAVDGFIRVLWSAHDSGSLYDLFEDAYIGWVSTADLADVEMKREGFDNLRQLAESLGLDADSGRVAIAAELVIIGKYRRINGCWFVCR